MAEAIHYLLCCTSELKNGTWISYFVYMNVFFSILSSAQSHVESMDLVPCVNSYPFSRLFLHALNRSICAIHVYFLNTACSIYLILPELSLPRRLYLAAVRSSAHAAPWQIAFQYCNMLRYWIEQHTIIVYWDNLSTRSNARNCCNVGFLLSLLLYSLSACSAVNRNIHFLCAMPSNFSTSTLCMEKQSTSLEYQILPLMCLTPSLLLNHCSRTYSFMWNSSAYLAITVQMCSVVPFGRANNWDKSIMQYHN